MPSKATHRRLQRRKDATNPTVPQAEKTIVTPSSPQTANVILKSFELFPLLPLEIRRLIWEAAFVPRKLLVDSLYSRPELGSPMANLRLVNWESNLVFLKHYKPILPETDCMGTIYNNNNCPVYMNFDIDTLCFVTGLELLSYFTHVAPKDMSKVRRIEISTYNQSGFPIYGSANLSNMNLSCLSIKTIIIVRPDVGYRNPVKASAASDYGVRQDFSGRGVYGTFDDESTENYGSRIIFTLLILRERYMRSTNFRKPYQGPQIGGFFTRTGNDSAEPSYFYLRTTSDLSHVQWGRLKTQTDIAIGHERGDDCFTWIGDGQWDYPRDDNGNRIARTDEDNTYSSGGYSRINLQTPNVFTRMFRENDFPKSCE